MNTPMTAQTPVNSHGAGAASSDATTWPTAPQAMANTIMVTMVHAAGFGGVASLASLMALWRALLSSYDYKGKNKNIIKIPHPVSWVG